jgi:predicted O-methyltransferase YrrM
MTLQEQIAQADGHRFQQKLGEFIAEKKLTNIFEIGSGVSSIFILQAMDDAGIDGMLHSIDTKMWYPHEIVHPKFNQIEGRSIDMLVEAFLKYGAPDLILSDGCHEIKDMTYEYEFGFSILKNGGYLVADDTSFGNNGAWETFLANHDLKEEIFGDARIVQKPEYMPAVVTIDNALPYHKNCLELAELAEQKWLEFGNKNSDVVWDTRV